MVLAVYVAVGCCFDLIWWWFDVNWIVVYDLVCGVHGVCCFCLVALWVTLDGEFRLPGIGGLLMCAPLLELIGILLIGGLRRDVMIICLRDYRFEWKVLLGMGCCFRITTIEFVIFMIASIVVFGYYFGNDGLGWY